ncbi:MAG TPA: FISUMP domain-containing protein [Gemmatimonadaceae bacterium]|nr:FISUMP domain-containing protein [Gemmatimonadaceae bacterium]
MHVNTMTDPRDQQPYPTFGIEGKTWLARNLDFQTPGSWCYSDDEKQCALYGRLYTREAALKACPPGWKLPTITEWVELATGLGGYYDLPKRDSVDNPRASYTALMTGSFSAQLGGSRSPAGKFIDVEGDGMYWSSSTCGKDSVTFMVFNEHSKRVMRDCDGDIGWAHSVRCLSEIHGSS